MQALSRWLLAIGLLLSLSCASGDLGVLVTVEGWPVEALSLRVATSLDGTPRRVLSIPSGQDRFVVRLSPGESGELLLEATALDGGDCKVATGRLSISLGPSLRPTQEARLLLTRLPNILCTVTVDFTEGAGSVVSDPAGLRCESAGTCEFDFPSGTPVQLVPSFDVKQQYVMWSGDCMGSASCSLLMDRSHHVEVAFTGRICTPTGFCWQNPRPQGSSLDAVWVDPDGVAWTVGDSGTVLRCRGTSCTSLDSGTTESFYALFGRSANEVWAVGYYGTVVKCSASACAVITTRQVNLTPLLSVWASESGEVWAVGYTGLVFKCSGSSCVTIPGTTTNRLPSVGGSESGEVWTVGDGGTVLKCSGTSCTPIPSGTSSDLYAVWVSRSGQAWAVGDNGTILQCGGSSCSPLASGRTDLLTGVSGSPSGAVFVHGVSGTLLKCTGTGCTPLATGTSSALNRVWISPSGEVWAAGDNGDLVKCSGDACALLSSGTGATLSGISGDSAGDVWAVGSAGAVVKCSGSKCRPLSSGRLPDLSTVFGSASGDVWAGGRALVRCSGGSCLSVPRATDTLIVKIRGTNGDVWAVGESGTILKCSGSSCIDISGGYNELYLDVAANPLGGAFVVGTGLANCSNISCVSVSVNGVSKASVVAGNSNETWIGGSMGSLIKSDYRRNQSVLVPTGTTESLKDLWMSSSGEVWTIAKQSIIRCSGSSCTPLPATATADLNAIWGSRNGEVWAVGKTGNVVKCSGASCSLIPKVTDEELRRVAGDDRGVVWALTSGRSILRCSGSSCAKLPLQGVPTLADLWVSAAGEVWVAGDNGAILRYAP